jgi:hypothetical protein
MKLKAIINFWSNKNIRKASFICVVFAGLTTGFILYKINSQNSSSIFKVNTKILKHEEDKTYELLIDIKPKKALGKPYVAAVTKRYGEFHEKTSLFKYTKVIGSSPTANLNAQQFESVKPNSDGTWSIYFKLPESHVAIALTCNILYDENFFGILTSWIKLHMETLRLDNFMSMLRNFKAMERQGELFWITVNNDLTIETKQIIRN